MELWIRSQNKTELMKVVDLDIYDTEEPKNYTIESRGIILGEYKTEERALEVLDEIQNQIKTLLYLKPKNGLKLDIIEAAKNYFEEMNNIDLIATDSDFEIEPITTNVIVYEMPEE